MSSRVSDIPLSDRKDIERLESGQSNQSNGYIESQSKRQLLNLSTFVFAFLTFALFLSDIFYVEFYVANNNVWRSGKTGAEAYFIKGLQSPNYNTDFTQDAYNLDAVIMVAAAGDFLIGLVWNCRDWNGPRWWGLLVNTFFTVFTICAISIRIAISPFALTDGSAAPWGVGIIGIIVAGFNLLASTAQFGFAK